MCTWSKGISAGTPPIVIAVNNPASTTEIIGTVTVVGNNTCKVLLINPQTKITIMIRSIINTLILIFLFIFSQVNVNIGDIPIGKSVIISYDVKVDKPFPSMINQGECSKHHFWINFSNVFTDDPDAMGANDPTHNQLSTLCESFH